MTPDQIRPIAEQFAQYADARELTIRGEDIYRFARVMLELGKQIGPGPFDKHEWPPVAAQILFGGANAQ